MAKKQVKVTAPEKFNVELTQEEYKMILTALAFTVCVDSNLTQTDAQQDEMIRIGEVLKKAGFKRKPKLMDLHYTPDSRYEDKARLEKILSFVDLIKD